MAASIKVVSGVAGKRNRRNTCQLTFPVFECGEIDQESEVTMHED